LDLGLMVVICALITEQAIIAFVDMWRFSLGFYANRLIPLIVSKVVLIVLLSETVILQARLSIANRKLEHERDNKLMNAEAVVAAIAHEVRQPLAAMSFNAAAGKQFLNQAPPNIAE